MKDDICLSTEADQGFTKQDEAAERLGLLLAEYAGGGYADDLDTLLVDVLVDLRHWAAANEVGFDSADGRALMHYDSESEGE